MEPTLFEIKPVDRECYRRLRDFLPERIIDVHAHIWLESLIGGPRQADARVASWPSRVARDNSVEDLLESYRLLLPGKSVTPLVFSTPRRDGDVDVPNGYVSRSATEHGLPALALARPEWSGEQIEQRVRAGGFLGVKVYLCYAPDEIPGDQIRIFDFLPPHQLDVIDRNGWIVMLHIPRPGRLGDPENLAQLVEIDRRWPGARVIVAHVGRAYCIENVGDAFDVLAGTRNLLVDISANTNTEVFRGLIRAVGPKRILFGSDLPILRMRMRRICEDGHYINIVPRGLYGDVSGDPNMRETDGQDAERLTLFFYEEIDAFRRAAEAEGLSEADVTDVFYENARRLPGLGEQTR